MEFFVRTFYHYFTTISSAIPSLIFVLLLTLGLLAVKSKLGVFVGVFGAGLLIFFIYSSVQDFENIHRYIYNHGVQGEMVISEFRDAGVIVNHVRMTESVAYIKLPSGDMKEIVFLNQVIPHYPPVERFSIREKTPYKIRYLQGDHRVFVIEAGASEDIEQAAQCAALLKSIDAVSSQLLLDPQNQTLKKSKDDLEGRYKKLCHRPVTKLDPNQEAHEKCQAIERMIQMLERQLLTDPENEGLRTSKEVFEGQLKANCKKNEG